MGTDTELEIFYDNIRYLRETNKLTQREMAKVLGIGVYSLRKLERGSLPSRLGCSIFCSIADSFGVKPKDMFKPLCKR